MKPITAEEAPVASPFVPSHKREFEANKVFTDRERPVTLFLRAFDPPPAGAVSARALAKERQYPRHCRFEDKRWRRESPSASCRHVASAAAENRGDIMNAGAVLWAISEGINIMHDLELVATITAWKQRRLDEIDTQIPQARRGDVDAPMAEIDRVRMDCETKQNPSLPETVGETRT
jgi:hypothetical protein